MDEIINKIINWGNEKGISNPSKQFNKLAEEMLEAHEACVEMAVTEDWTGTLILHLKEELGDIGVVWILLCNMLDVDPLEALEIAHNKNKNRKGKTVKGNFIKEEDLNE